VVIDAILQFASRPILSWQALVTPVLISVLGVLTAAQWERLNERQIQYMEFCRRTLRNLEHRLGCLGFPLHYFTVESLIFGPHRDNPPNLPGTTVRSEAEDGRQHHVVTFDWSQEEYPETKCKKKSIHRIGQVRGGMIRFERSVAQLAKLVWAAILFAFLVLGISKALEQNIEDTRRSNQASEVTARSHAEFQRCRWADREKRPQQ